MKRPVPVLLLLLLLLTACTLLLCGCGMLNQHAKAIQSAIVDYSDYYIEVHNLSEQVNEQYKQRGTLQGAIDYTITIYVPDYSAYDPAAVGFDAPAPDYAAMSASQYKAASAYALRRSLEAYAYDNVPASYIELPVVFSITETDDGVLAAMSSISRNSIKNAVDDMVGPLLDSYDAYTQNYRFATVADARFSLLENLFGEDYIALSGVQKVTDSGGGAYELTLVYPDPYDVFNALAQQYYESFNQPFYGDAITVSLDADDLSDIDAESIRVSTNSVSIALDGESGICTLIDASVVESQISAAKMQAESAAAQRVNEDWRVPEIAAPSNGAVLEGESRGNKIVFVADASLGTYYYVRFYLLPEDDVNQDGTLAAGLFVLGGKRASVRLPSGYYRVVCDIGEHWYGLDALFGPDATTFDSGNTIRSRSGYINTISFE
jgi:hypothetical protein